MAVDPEALAAWAVHARRTGTSLTERLDTLDDGVVWIDVPSWDDEAEELLAKRYDLHPRAVRDCAARNPVPKVHVYPDHVFVVLHAPEFFYLWHFNYF